MTILRRSSRLLGATSAGLLALAGDLSAGTAPSSLTQRWFQATEQGLMDSIAPGHKAPWIAVMDPSCVVTTEEGQTLTKAQIRRGPGPTA